MEFRMNWLDMVLIFMVVSAGIVGMWIGLIRAAFTTLEVVLGILIASQVSGNLGGLYAGSINNEGLANVIAYGLVILAAVVVARAATIIVCKILDFLLMAWADKLAGLVLGSVAGVAISVAAIGGLAELTYNADLIERGVEAGGLQGRADSVEVKERLESALMKSSLVGVFLNVSQNLPANALGFVPSQFMTALETLELRIDS